MDPGIHDVESWRQLREVSQNHGLILGEDFRLMVASVRGEFAWILEFLGLAGVEVWIDAETAPRAGVDLRRDFHLARRWAPDYFAT